MAELNKAIAIVGVLPPLTLAGCNACNCGSVVVTTPGQAPKGCVPEPFCMIKLPAPLTETRLVKKHSLAPLFAIIVF